MSNTTRVRAAVAVLAVSYFALWACAPVASGPPPAPMVEGREHELGGAISWVQGVGPGANALGNGCVTTDLAGGCGGPAVAGWYRFDRGRWDLTTQLYGGLPNFFGANVRVAGRLVDTERVFVAPLVQGGWLTGGAGVTTGVALSEGTWLVVTPEAKISVLQLYRGSVGVWHNRRNGVVLGLEAGAAFGPPNVPPTVDLSLLLGGQVPPSGVN